MAKRTRKVNKKSQKDDAPIKKNTIFNVIDSDIDDTIQIDTDEGTDTVNVVKQKTLFEHLSGLKELKVSWESLSEMDKKTFEPFMINRFLSMDIDNVEIINMLQQYKLSPREYYKIYLEILPKKRTFSKYIKGEADDKYNKNILQYLCKYYQVSKSQVIEYMEFMSDDDIVNIIKKYGIEDKQIRKWLKG